MSARDLLLPNRALQDTLRQLQSRLITAQRRARFPGATNMAESAGPTTIPDTPTWLNLVSFDLDRGRWLLTGGFWVTTQRSGAFAGEFWVDIQLVAGLAASPIYTDGLDPGNFLNPTTISDGAMVVWTVSLAEPQTVHLRARSGGNPFPCIANDMYMIAAAG